MSTNQNNDALMVPQSGQAPIVAGFGSSLAFDFMQRQAQMLASSELVPVQFSIVPEKNRPALTKDEKAVKIANTVIALEMANRIGASPLMVMQNLYIVHGKPSWSSQFIIAAINSTGSFSPIRYKITDPEPEREVTTEIVEWAKGAKQTKTIKEKICNRVCIAYAIEKATGETLESPPVSLEMAVKEGWYSKSGSKWPVMPELMLRYRAATLFGRLYAPEILMGMQTQEEADDITTTVDISPVESKAAEILRRFPEEGSGGTEKEVEKACEHPTSARKWGGLNGKVLSCTDCGTILRDDNKDESVNGEFEMTDKEKAEIIRQEQEKAQRSLEDEWGGGSPAKK